MFALEKRLAETEKALFFALHELHDGEAVHADYKNEPSYEVMREFITSNDTPSTQQEKAERMASWARRPLQNRTQARAWLESVRTVHSAADDFHRETVANASLASSAVPVMAQGNTTLLRTQSVSDRVGDSESDGNILPEQLQQRKTSHLRGRRSGGSATRPSEPFSSQMTGGAADPSRSVSPSSRASSFARENQKIYF